MQQKEGCAYDVVCVHDWLSSIAGIITKNETTVSVAFHVHSTEWGRSGGQGSEVVSHLESAMAQRADKIITVSHAMQEDLIRHGWPKTKISVIWNGVDPERYNPKKCKPEEVEAIRNSYGINPDEKMVLFSWKVNMGQRRNKPSPSNAYGFGGTAKYETCYFG